MDSMKSPSTASRKGVGGGGGGYMTSSLYGSSIDGNGIATSSMYQTPESHR